MMLLGFLSGAMGIFLVFMAYKGYSPVKTLQLLFQGQSPTPKKA